MWILPVLASAVVATGTHADVEQALTAGLRARVAAGWAVADIRTERDELVVTIADGRAVERHVIAFGDDETYRVETDAALPADPIEPAPLTIQALTTIGGGLEITAGCGDYTEIPYFVEDAADRDLAPRLVASTLATADDLTLAWVADHRATFAFERDGRALSLIARLDPTGRVIGAEIRSYGGDAEPPRTYRVLSALKRMVRHGRVTRILDDGGTTLITRRGRFAIAPDDSVYDREPVEGDEGCGC